MKGASQVDLSKVLLVQLEDECLCDVTLTVGVEQFHAHRCVLAAMSPYFKAMFTGQFMEKEATVIDMSASFQDKKTLQDIVKFMYGCDVDITEDNVEEYLKASSFFQVPELSLLCWKFLFASLRVDNCLWMWTLADIYNCQELSDKCCTVATSVFPETFMDKEETLTIPLNCLLKFLNTGLCSRCKPERIRSFLERYLQIHSSDKKIRKKIFKAAGLIDVSVTSSYLSEKENDARRSSATRRSKRLSSRSAVSMLQCKSDGNARAFQYGKDGKGNYEEEMTTLLCWQKRDFPSKNVLLFYSLAQDNWYTLEFDSGYKPDKLVGYITIGDKNKEIALVFSLETSFILYNLSTRAYKSLPLFPDGFPTKEDGNIVTKSTNAVYKNESVGSFYLNENFYVVRQCREDYFYPYNLPSQIKVYIVKLDQNSLDRDTFAWKYVCCVQQFHGMKLPGIKCKVTQLSDKEAYVVMKQGEELCIYKLTPHEQHEPGNTSLTMYQKKLSIHDIDKFNESPLNRERSYDSHFRVFEVANDICIDLGWGCTSFNPAMDDFVKPIKSVSMQPNAPFSKESSMKESGIKHGSSIYSPETGLEYCIGSSMTKVHFIVSSAGKTIKGPGCVSVKCPVFGAASYLLHVKPNILFAQEGFVNNLTHIAATDYKEPLLISSEVDASVDNYTTRIKPLDDLVLNKHRLDSRERCTSCSCQKELNKWPWDIDNSESSMNGSHDDDLDDDDEDDDDDDEDDDDDDDDNITWDRDGDSEDDDEDENEWW